MQIAVIMGNVREIADRQSNFELLRLVCAFSIVLLHANFFTFGIPEDTSALKAFFRIFFQVLCIPSVYAFVLISGWFSVQIRLKSLFNLFFMLVFWGIIRIAILWIVGAFGTDWIANLKMVNPIIGWFIPCYLCMLCFVSVINLYTSSVNTHDLRRYVFAIVCIMMLSDSVLHCVDCWQGGYSTISLMCVYCVGRYLRLDGQRLLSKSKSFYGCLFFAVTVVWSVAIFIVLKSFPEKISGCTILAMTRYTFPFSVICSVCLFMFFCKIKVESKVVNRLALSAFPIIGYHLSFAFIKFVRMIDERFFGGVFILVLVIFLLCVSALIITIDQIRIWLWSIILIQIRKKR